MLRRLLEMSGAVIRGRLRMFFFLLAPSANSFSYANHYLTVISMNTTDWPHYRRNRMGIRFHRFKEQMIEGEKPDPKKSFLPLKSSSL